MACRSLITINLFSQKINLFLMLFNWMFLLPLNIFPDLLSVHFMQIFIQTSDLFTNSLVSFDLIILLFIHTLLS